jgi:trimethylamine--corrinoid protein Co-methyltransferase
MPLAGAAAPVTLLGSVVQHAAESLSGIAIHQLASPGAPIVWGGAPTIFEMRHGTTPMGAIETAMIDAAYAQVGKSLGLPTHAYLGATDAKIVDAQAGMQSGMTALVGALAGINMISGAGMLDFLICQSAEKLVIDAEGIAMTQRLMDGLQVRSENLATAFFEGIDFKADFLNQKATRNLFRLEQHQHSHVIDRTSFLQWQSEGSMDTFTRARDQVRKLIASYQRPEIKLDKERELVDLVTSLAYQAGMEQLPSLDL